MSARTRAIVLDVEHFRLRVLQDALSEATRCGWLRRAAAFEKARPKVGEYTGRATPGELAGQDAELAAIATACRNRAAVALVTLDDVRELLWTEEAAA